MDMTAMAHEFQPVNQTHFREAMRQLAAGVVIVTAVDGGRRYGITATSAASVSEDPPLMSVGINKASWVCDALMQARKFCINILAADQLDVARAFSSSPREQRFATGTWTELVTGAPALKGALASFDCEFFTSIEVKTHHLVIGHILKTNVAERMPPLIYLDRNYLTVRPVSMSD